MSGRGNTKYTSGFNTFTLAGRFTLIITMSNICVTEYIHKCSRSLNDWVIKTTHENASACQFQRERERREGEKDEYFTLRQSKVKI